VEITNNQPQREFVILDSTQQLSSLSRCFYRLSWFVYGEMDNDEPPMKWAYQDQSRLSSRTSPNVSMSHTRHTLGVILGSRHTLESY
jgi:hypothetical protein